jgi:hypothetical protein
MLSPEAGVQLGAVFQTADQWLTRTTQANNQPVAGSSVARDDKEISPWHVSTTVLIALSGAVDHFHAAKTMLADAGKLHTYAMFSLLRPALENAATAVYLLGPSNRNVRLLRALRLAWSDLADQNKLSNLLGHQPATPLDVRKTELQNLARACGMAQEDIETIAARPAGYAAIVRAAGDESLKGGGSLMEAIWMLNSGSIHGKKWATWTKLDRSKLVPSGTPGVLLGPVTAPESQVLFSAIAAKTMISKAWELYDRRALTR